MNPNAPKIMIMMMMEVVFYLNLHYTSASHIVRESCDLRYDLTA